jgi:hypothetical protein
VFVIKLKQLDALTEIRLDAFKKRLEEHLVKHFEQIINKLTKEQLEYFIDEGIKRAEEYGLKTEYQIMVYFNVMLTLGVDFEKDENYEWAADILEDDELTAEKKVEKIIEFTETELSK